MPSSKKTVLKDLHQANSVSELNSLAEVKTEKTTSLNVLCKTADKVYLKAQDFDMTNDEEMAYVFFMRYFNIIAQIKKSPHYKKEKLHIDKLLGDTKSKKAITQAEKLQSSLIKRYGERQKMKEDEEMAKKLIARTSRKDDENQPKESKRVKPSSVDDDLDNLLDGPAISSPSDIYQKLKVNHSSILTPEGTNLSNGVHDTNTLIPDLSKPTAYLTAEQLYSIMKSVSNSDLLILDIRTQKEYAKNHIHHASCINIPAEFLENGVSVSNIERRLQERTRVVWCQRGTKNYVIILDKSSKVTDISPASKIYQLKEAIFKYDTNCTLKNEPLFLDGGFDDWLWHYPSLATKPELPTISSSSKLNETIDVSALDFPEIPTGNKIIPDPPPVETQIKPSVDNSEFTKPNEIYPPMPNIKQTVNGNQGQNTNLPSSTSLQPQVNGRSTSYPHPESHNGVGKEDPAVFPHTAVTGTVGGGQYGPQTLVNGNQAPSSQAQIPGHPIVPRSQAQVPGHPSVPRSQAQMPGHPIVPSSQAQVPGHPMVPSSQAQIPGHPSVPSSQAQVPGHPTVPSSQAQVPGHPMVPSSQAQVPGHPTVPSSQAQVPGHPTVPSSQAQVPGHPMVPSSQAQVPGHPTVPSSQAQVPGHPTVPSSQAQVPGHPMVPSSQAQVPSNQHQMPAHDPHILNNPAQVSGNPPTFTYGQTVNSGQYVPSTQNTGKPSSVYQGGANPVSQSKGTQGSGYETTKGLPPGWERCYDKTNKVFYKDHNSQTTHWTLPKFNPVVKPQVDTEKTQNIPSSPIPKQPLPQVKPQPPTPTKQQIPQPQPTVPKQQPQMHQPPVQHPPVQHPPVQHPPVQHPPVQHPQSPMESQGAISSSGPTAKAKTGLRRSLSSPNLAKLEDNEPQIDRSSKPVEPVRKPSFSRNSKPLTTLRLDSLNPVRGGIGRGLTGLRNLGNTCYMNSVLQCLFSTAPLAAYFISGAFREDLNTKNPMGTRGELAEQFSILVRVTNSGQYKSISPSDFKRTVGKIKSAFSGFDQQDSQEFLTLMMDKLHEDVNKINKKPYLPAPEDNMDSKTAAELAWSNHKKRNQSIMLELFDGLFMSTVRCMTCTKESVTFETFSNLTLPLPTRGGNCSLEACLKLFIRPEKMSGDDKWFCPKCKQHREAIKQLQIWRLPPILVIHLKRFQYDGMWRQKLQTGVLFPLKDLDMTDYVKGPKSSSYSLFSISNHYGTMHGGHYTAYCLNSYDKRWYKFDDQLVTEMSSAGNVVTSAGYLLFYTSLPFTPPKLF